MVYNVDTSENNVPRELNRLNGSDMAPVLDYLRNTKANLYVTLAEASEMKDVFRLQGRIQAIEDFLDDVARSRGN